MSRRNLGIVVGGAGAILVLIAALADMIGIGDATEFGLRQIWGVIGGVVAIVAGGWRPASHGYDGADRR
ncbi:MAG: hypothetical protein ACXWH0_03575 [Acidimicrobiia bacterium]